MMSSDFLVLTRVVLFSSVRYTFCCHFDDVMSAGSSPRRLRPGGFIERGAGAAGEGGNKDDAGQKSTQVVVFATAVRLPLFLEVYVMIGAISSVDEVCASCGVTGGGDVKLKLCTACKLVRYCSVDCQKNHRSKHKKACKKRASEKIRDDKLFTQPVESYLGECPICCLPLPLDENKRRISSCCCKMICLGCCCANKQREREQGLEHKCAYCREPLPDTEEEAEQNLMKRVKANDPFALVEMGRSCYDEGDYEGAFQYWTKAAELGNMGAHHNLSCLYDEGEGVEKDKKTAVYHLEEAAIGGHPDARYNLGIEEIKSGKSTRAVKHWIISANLGHDEALAALEKGFRAGVVSTDCFEAAVRGHQAAVDATKSQQRDAAEKAK